MLAADVRQSYLTTFPTNTESMEIAKVNEIFSEMEERAVSELGAQGFARAAIELTRQVDAKYPYQLHELIVSAPSGTLGADDAQRIAGTFHEHHERLYTYCMREMPVDVNGFRVTAVGRLPELPLIRQEQVGTSASSAAKGMRDVYFPELGEFVETPIFDGAKLRHGMVVGGPAVAELATTTLVVFPAHTLSVNANGDFHIEIPAGHGSGRSERTLSAATAS
jgi:N-methylhydantoinase A